VFIVKFKQDGKLMQLWTHEPIACELGTVRIGGIVYVPDPPEGSYKGLVIDTVHATLLPLLNARNFEP